MISFAPYVITINRTFPQRPSPSSLPTARPIPVRCCSLIPGIGLANHLTNLQVVKAWGIEVKHVPYKGGSRRHEVRCLRRSPPDDQQHYRPRPPSCRADQVLLIAVSGDQRHTSSTICRPSRSCIAARRRGSWQGLLTTAGSPAALVTRLNTELVKILAMPDIVKRLNDLGAEVKSGPPSDMAPGSSATARASRPIIKESGSEAAVVATAI